MSERNDSILINDDEAREVLRMTRTYFFAALRDEKFAPGRFKVGRRFVIRRAELIDWINAGMPARADWTWQPSAGASVPPTHATDAAAEAAMSA